MITIILMILKNCETSVITHTEAIVIRAQLEKEFGYLENVVKRILMGSF